MQYDAQRLLNELADMSWKLGSIDSLLKRILRWVQLSGNQAVEDRVRHIAVDDLVLSQVDKPKSTYQPVRFRMKLPLSVKVCTG